jgi:hypothetical protein
LTYFNFNQFVINETQATLPVTPLNATMISNFQIIVNYTSATGNLSSSWTTDTAVNLIAGLGLTQDNMAVWFTFRFFNTSGFFWSLSISGLTNPGTGVSVYNSAGNSIANSSDLCALRRTSATTVQIHVLSPKNDA